MAVYTGINGVKREVQKIYTGVNGVKREVKSGWTGVNGVKRKVFESSMPCNVSGYVASTTYFFFKTPDIHTIQFYNHSANGGYASYIVFEFPKTFTFSGSGAIVLDAVLQGSTGAKACEFMIGPGKGTAPVSDRFYPDPSIGSQRLSFSVPQAFSTNKLNLIGMSERDHDRWMSLDVISEKLTFYPVEYPNGLKLRFTLPELIPPSNRNFTSFTAELI